MKISNKKGAIELSIGTIVIIVLAMSMLILGLVLVRTIFTTSIESVRQIDQGVKNEINKIFSENKERRLVLYPDSGIIKLDKGSQDEGFAIAIRNINPRDTDFRVLVSQDKKGTCPEDPKTKGYYSFVSGDDFTIKLPPNEVMENPRHVRLAIAPTAPACTFTLKIEVREGTNAYMTDYMDVQIKQK